jgi:hypothetical protein
MAGAGDGSGAEEGRAEVNLESTMVRAFRVRDGLPWRRTRFAAFRDFAAAAFRSRYPCECEPDVGYSCGCDDPGVYVRRRFAINRYAAMLTRRAGFKPPKRAATSVRDRDCELQSYCRGIRSLRREDEMGKGIEF